MNKKVWIVGGGTVSDIKSHLALAATAYGTAARQILDLANDLIPEMTNVMTLTKMANPANQSAPNTYEDMDQLAQQIIDDPLTKIVFWTCAIVDFSVHMLEPEDFKIPGRISSGKSHQVLLNPYPKIATKFRAERKDIFLVSFKQTHGETEEEQYNQGLKMLKKTSSNLVLANDTKSRVNMIITPEEGSYSVTTDRFKALKELVEIAKLRSHLTFTRSTVVAGETIPWDSELIPETLKKVVDYCILQGVYKEVTGVTAGHFAIKLDNTTFLTSRRKTNFNDMKNVGLVKIETDGPDSVIAYGSKPSVGGQSQRIVFDKYKDLDCIVHFHCEKKSDSLVPTISQREYECGSHECGQNTANGLKQFGNLYAVYLDNHGPNIVFNKSIDPQEVIDFIDNNFDLETKTGGYKITSAATT